VIREAVHWEPAGGYVVWHAWNPPADLWPLSDALQRGIHRLNKFQAKAKSLAVVPDSGVFEFGGGFRFWAERPGHRSVNR
jgi:hypothetical protein